MVYLLSEIAGALIIVAIVAFALGWTLRGFRERINKRRHSTASNENSN